MDFDAKNIRRRLDRLRPDRAETEDALRVYGPSVQRTLISGLKARTAGEEYDPVADLSQRISGVPLAEAQRRYDAWGEAFTAHVRIQMGEEAFAMLPAKLAEIDDIVINPDGTQEKRKWPSP